MSILCYITRLFLFLLYYIGELAVFLFCFLWWFFFLSVSFYHFTHLQAEVSKTFVPSEKSFSLPPRSLYRNQILFWFLNPVYTALHISLSESFSFVMYRDDDDLDEERAGKFNIIFTIGQPSGDEDEWEEVET